jgi:hypothetical protein
VACFDSANKKPPVSDGNLATFQFLYRVALNTAAREMLDDIRGLGVSDEQKVGKADFRHDWMQVVR